MTCVCVFVWGNWTKRLFMPGPAYSCYLCVRVYVWTIMGKPLSHTDHYSDLGFSCLALHIHVRICGLCVHGGIEPAGFSCLALQERTLVTSHWCIAKCSKHESAPSYDIRIYNGYASTLSGLPCGPCCWYVPVLVVRSLLESLCLCRGWASREPLPPTNGQSAHEKWPASAWIQPKYDIRLVLIYIYENNWFA